MTSKEKMIYQKELSGVIDTARKIRDYMIDTSIPLNERKQEISTFRTANEANKSIVSAVINTIAIEKLGE